MKKVLSLILVIMLVITVLCGCSSGDKLEIILNDGTIENMTADELYSWKLEYEGRNFSEFESMLDGATISGTGTITQINIHKPSSFNYYSKEATSFQTHIILDNGVALYFSLECDDGYNGYVDGSYTKTSYPELDLYENDKISFSGTMSMCEYDIEEDGVTITLEDIEIEETESVVPLDRIYGVELVTQ